MPADAINLIHIERVALDLLDQYSITAPGFDIEDLAYAEGYVIKRGGLTNIDAWLVRHPGGGGIIRLRDDTLESGRVRFSIGHELGHAALHPKLSQGFLCTAADMTDYIRSPQEAEANSFAIQLLMPRTWLPQDLWKEDPDFGVVSRLASEFSTTLTAASRRYVELSPRAVVLVFARDGVVQWYLQGGRAKYLHVARGSTVPAHSLTQECLAHGKSAGPESIEPSTWFPNLQFGRDSELFEDVRYSGTYRWTLTLLWVPEFE